MLSPAPLNAPSMLSAMESLNRPLEENFRAFLSETVADRGAHGRFLNLLSLLEHLGSRKIMLSQMRGVLTQDILKHLAEETRHAFFFKRQAEKMLDRAIEGYDDRSTLAAAAGKFYFGRLDAGLTRDLPPGMHPETGYLLVSLIVELRALWVYRMYQQALDAAGLPVSLKSIIAEEDSHLSDMAGRLAELDFAIEARLPACCNLEKRLFEKLVAGIAGQYGVMHVADRAGHA